MTKAQKAERQEAIEQLRKWIKPGDTVYTILDHVSRSGMSRNIRVLVALAGEPGEKPSFIHPNHSVALAINMPRASKGDGIKIGGCGSDMGFEIVYSLGRALYPDGVPCIGNGCPSNDHTNGDRDYAPHGGVSGCHGGPCTCHDPHAWTFEGSYANGCSSCGCHRVEHVHRDGGYSFKHSWL